MALIKNKVPYYSMAYRALTQEGGWKREFKESTFPKKVNIKVETKVQVDQELTT